MRIAILADIHGNLEALTACRSAAARQGVDRTVYLGDIVGYGADPAACLDLVRADVERGALVVRGNHDEAVAEGRLRMSDAATTAARWTASVLDDERRRWLGNLPMTAADDDRLYVHASPEAPARYRYVHGLSEASESLVGSTAHLTLCGHVHVPALYNATAAGKVMSFRPVEDMPIPLLPQRRWLAVVGAVGQPRDGNPAAAYAIVDTDDRSITFRRVPYDIATAASKIRAAGLPDNLWKRLAVGH